MGHKTLSVTASYAHGTPDAMRRAVNRLSGRPRELLNFERRVKNNYIIFTGLM